MGLLISDSPTGTSWPETETAAKSFHSPTVTVTVTHCHNLLVTNTPTHRVPTAVKVWKQRGEGGRPRTGTASTVHAAVSRRAMELKWSNVCVQTKDWGWAKAGYMRLGVQRGDGVCTH